MRGYIICRPVYINKYIDTCMYTFIHTYVNKEVQKIALRERNRKNCRISVYSSVHVRAEIYSVDDI